MVLRLIAFPSVAVSTALVTEVKNKILFFLLLFSCSDTGETGFISSGSKEPLSALESRRVDYSLWGHKRVRND